LVQDFLGFLMQLFCGDDANVPEVTPSKCPRKTKIVHGVMLSTALSSEMLKTGCCRQRAVWFTLGKSAARRGSRKGLPVPRSPPRLRRTARAEGGPVGKWSGSREWESCRQAVERFIKFNHWK
jgi:hypothetical protein